MSRNRRNKRKKLLVLVNPRSGTGHSLKLLKDCLEPVLEAKRLEYEVILTKYQGHALDIVLKGDFKEYTGIVTISGDGIVHEVINGLYRRKDWDTIADKIPIGLIPGGSGCALNCSLLRQLNQPLDGRHKLGLDASVINVSEGARSETTVPLDLIEVELVDGSKMMSLLGVTIGVIADGDIGTEWLRCLGFLRSYLHVGWRLIFPSPYLARVSYLPLELDEDGDPIPVSPEDDLLNLPPLSEAVPDTWVTEEDRYHVVYALNISTLDPMTVFAPKSRLGDGVMWMVFVRGSISRLELISWFSALSDGPDFSSKHLDIVPVRAFRIEPLDPKDGILSLDAESAPYGPVQGQVIPKQIRIFAHTD